MFGTGGSETVENFGIYVFDNSWCRPNDYTGFKPAEEAEDQPTEESPTPAETPAQPDTPASEDENSNADEETPAEEPNPTSEEGTASENTDTTSEPSVTPTEP